MAEPSTIAAAREFLSLHRIALVGVSREEKSFSRFVLRELLARGYDVVPVNPLLPRVEGRDCFARVQDILPPVGAALLLTPPAGTAAAVEDCVAAKVRMVWMHRGQGAGSATPEAIAACRAAGIAVVTDLCPFMALPGASWPHRLHGFFRRLGRPRAGRPGVAP